LQPQFKLQDLVFVRGNAYRKGGEKSPTGLYKKYLKSADASYTSLGVKGLINYLFIYNNNNNNNNNLLTANGLSPGGSGYFTFKLRQTY
jgi:hypothetical protein